jgi:hypothetical protein
MVNKMTKVRFEVDEWYPVYQETDVDFSGTFEIELTQYELFKIRRTFQEFKHVQELIKSKMEE